MFGPIYHTHCDFAAHISTIDVFQLYKSAGSHSDKKDVYEEPTKLAWLITILSRVKQGYSEVDDKCNLALELFEVIPVIQFAYGHDQTILYVSSYCSKWVTYVHLHVYIVIYC